MAFTNSNDYITGRKSAPTPSGCELVSVRFTIDLGTADLALNTIGQVGILPAGCVPEDVLVDGTDMDSSTAAVIFQVGIWDGSSANLSTAAADGGAAWGSTTAVNTSFKQRLTFSSNAIDLVTAAQTDRKLGVKVTTAPTAAVAGTLGVTLRYRAA
ncbi:hypothetical protein [Roseateles sp.]|uniref:hypothetical protein n=1 Tax=Roseateles sp. TaxID=1971397 RepID=UPI002DFF7F64|nr:hypothetical protein [Roseateles sp.]